MFRPILTDAEFAVHNAAMEAACARLAAEGNTPGAVAAWYKAEGAFQAAQIEALRAWPYAYAGGEVPQAGDEIEPADEGESVLMRVIALEPPELRVGGHLDDLTAMAKAIGAELHPAMSRAIPQLCRLVRRAHPLPES